MRSRRIYGDLDDPPVIVSDRGFTGFKSSIKANVLPEGVLSDSRNARIENGEIETRKGCDVVYFDPEFSDAYASCRYINPVAGSAQHSAIAVAGRNKLTIFDPEDGNHQVPYHSGQIATGDAELVESFGSLFIYRGRGTTLPSKFPLDCGEYPLQYDGETPTAGGIFKMPSAVVLIQIYPHSRLSDQVDVDLGLASEVGITFSECRADLAPIESRADSWYFDAENWTIDNSASNSTTGHNFSHGDTIKFNGTGSYDGVYKVRKIDFNTISLVGGSIPSGPLERNTGATGWKENSNLRPADYAVTTASRLAYVSGPDLIQFSDAFAPTIINPYFNRVMVNEGAGDYITALLPVQDDSLLVFKRSSIYLITATSTLGENLRVIEVTRQMVCACKGSIQEVGNLIYFLSDGGIYAVDAGIRNESNMASPMQALEVLSIPTSESINDKLGQVDFSYAEKFISAYFDNRYFLAVVTKESGGQLSRIFVYNQLLKQWETIDEFPDGFFAQEFVVIPDNGINKLFVVGKNSQILTWGTNELGVDSFYDERNELTSNSINFSISTRNYDAESFNIKRFHRIGSAITKLTDEDTGVTFGYNTSNPDTATLVYANAPLDRYRKTYRLICRKKGQQLSVTITNRRNKFFSGGRIKVSEIFTEASICARATRSYSDTTQKSTRAYDIEEGYRPSVDRINDDPILVSDPNSGTPL